MFSAVICPASEQYPRHSEGDIAVLPDGRLLLAYTRFRQGRDDASSADIIGRYSLDNGRNWGNDFVLHTNDAKQNCMSASLLMLPSNELLLFFLRKNASTDLQVCLKRSADLGPTWSETTQVTDGNGYYVMNNARVLRLSSGRLLAPVACCDDSDGPFEGSGHAFVSCCLSDDEGHTWRTSPTRLDVPKRGAMEPGLVECKDGSVLMIIRTQLGRIYRALSKDGGETWGELRMLPLVSPEAPATVTRIPGRSDMLMIWNNNHASGAGHGGVRSPLTAAISSNEGEEWYNFRNLENDPHSGYAYTSITFSGSEALLTYYQLEPDHKLSLKFRAVPVSWFYERDRAL